MHVHCCKVARIRNAEVFRLYRKPEGKELEYVEFPTLNAMADACNVSKSWLSHSISSFHRGSCFHLLDDAVAFRMPGSINYNGRLFGSVQDVVNASGLGEAVVHRRIQKASKQIHHSKLEVPSNNNLSFGEGQTGNLNRGRLLQATQNVQTEVKSTRTKRSLPDTSQGKISSFFKRTPK